MELRRLRRRDGFVSSSNPNKPALLFFLCVLLLVFSTCALLSTVLCNGKGCSEIKSLSDAGYSHAQGAKSRRRLGAGGPGSFPPRCSAKCGACTPCFPVHVAVPPGTPVTTEYYPEAWRCKCDNRLYMP